MTTDKLTRMETARDRLCRLMDWPTSTSHKFEIIRRTMNGDAIALGIDKAEALAERIEALEAELTALRAK